MSNRAAFAIGLLIVLAVAGDLWFGTGAIKFLARKFVDLTEYLAFWR